MPFLIFYSKKIFAVRSQQIGNFLLLKVIGTVLIGITRLQEKGMKLFFKKGNMEIALIEIIKDGGNKQD